MGFYNDNNMMLRLRRNVLHPMKMRWYDVQMAVIGPWRFFRKQQRMMERRLTRSRYATPCRFNEVPHCVVFQCNGYTWHGGLADRLKGIVSVFDWCERHDRNFRINFVEPFRLSDYLVPASYDWRIEETQLSYDSHNAAPVICLLEPRTGRRCYFRENKERLLQEWLDNNLADTTRQTHVYTNMTPGTEQFDAVFADAFNRLFAPAPPLRHLLERHRRQIGGKYISISFRFTTLLGDFRDCTAAVLPPEERQPLIDRCLNAVTSIAAGAPPHDKILITADSPAFLAQATRLPGVYIVPGKTGHIDYDGGDDVTTKTFLDFLLIAGAEAVYLARSGAMYRSSFARTAAMINRRPFHVVEF